MPQTLLPTVKVLHDFYHIESLFIICFLGFVNTPTYWYLFVYVSKNTFQRNAIGFSFSSALFYHGNFFSENKLASIFIGICMAVQLFCELLAFFSKCLNFFVVHRVAHISPIFVLMLSHLRFILYSTMVFHSENSCLNK